MGLILLYDLASKRCKPCEGGVPPLREYECEDFISGIDKGWSIVDGHHLREYGHFRTS